MHFLAPLFGLLGAAAAVPLLLHLMRRRAGARIEFPAVRYLARAEREHSRRLKLRNLLLMMLRVAAVLAIALGAAGPVSRLLGLPAVFGAAHAPSAVAIVVDNSLSTSVVIRGRTVLDRLVDAADGVFDRLTSADRVWLVTADGVVQGGTVATVRAALHRVRPLGGAGDPPGAVVRGAVLAAGQARSAGMGDAVVAVVTDGQATTWQSAAVDVGSSRAVFFVPPDAPPANHAVALVESRPERWTPRGEVAARLSGVTDSVAYRIDLGGRTLARGTATAGDPTISVHASPSERGWVAGSVVLDPDELRADDTRHFAVWIGEPPVVVVDSGVGPFVREAVTTLETTGRASGGTKGIEIVSADRLDQLPALIVAPADPVRVGAANRALERAGVPWRFGLQLRTGGDLRTLGDDVTVSMRYALEPHGAAAADTIARVGDAAWAVGGPGYVVLASPMDPAATTLPIRASFVPWMADLLAQRLGPGAGGGGVLQATPGAVLTRPQWADARERDDGSAEPLSGVTMRAPEVAGVTFLRRGGARVGALVVNGEARESDLRRMPLRAMAARAPWITAVFEGGGGRPLATPLFLLALALLITESVLTRKQVAR